MRSSSFPFVLIGSAFALIGCNAADAPSNEVRVETTIPEVVSEEAPGTDSTISEMASGTAPELLVNDMATPLEFRTINGTSATPSDTFILLSSTLQDPSPSGRTRAPSVVIDNDLEARLAGQDVRIAVTACADQAGTPIEYAVAYSTNKYGNSGWQTFTVGQACETSSFTYAVPGPEAGEAPAWNRDFLGIHPDMSGQGRGLRIKSVTIETLG